MDVSRIFQEYETETYEEIFMTFFNKPMISFLLVFSTLALSSNLFAREHLHYDPLIGAHTAVDEFSNYNISIIPGGSIIFSTTSSLGTFDGVGFTRGTTWTGCWKKTCHHNYEFVATNTVGYVNCETVCSNLSPGYRQKAVGKLTFDPKTGEGVGTATITVHAWSDLKLEKPLAERIAHIRTQQICSQ